MQSIARNNPVSFPGVVDTLMAPIISRLTEFTRGKSTDVITAALSNLNVSLEIALSSSDSEAQTILYDYLGSISNGQEPYAALDIEFILKAHRSGKLTKRTAASALIHHFGALKSEKVERMTSDYIWNILDDVKAGQLSAKKATLGLQDSADAAQL